jgi:predicted enzyme related to lactoylglutathione lyase
MLSNVKPTPIRGSTCSILNVTFDCLDSEAVAGFWSAVTGWPRSFRDMPGNPFWVVAQEGDGVPHLVFVTVPKPKNSKNRVHLDLLPRGGSQDAEVIRIESLGGRIVDDRRRAVPGGWVVMADPEGNEFCVEGGE